MKVFAMRTNASGFQENINSVVRSPVDTLKYIIVILFLGNEALED